jgi:putative oxidoreductase
MFFNWLDRYRDGGLLILRLGIGAMFIMHGFPKLAGGPPMWGKLGLAMGTFGIHFAPTFWGFMAASAEFFGGLLIACGLFFRISSGLLCTTMIVAMNKHLFGGDGIKGASHAIEAGILFLSLILIGPGKYSLDSYIAGKKKKK